MRALPFLLSLWLGLVGSSHAFDSDHAAWTALLERHVVATTDGNASQVDYAGFAADRAALDAYRTELTAVTPEVFAHWSKSERLAFLINAYNAHTVALILTKWPDLKSIKDIGGLFSSPWKQKFFRLLGEEHSLDDIEQSLIRGAADFDEPRVHFALNCASIGCPALRREAYVGARLATQLDEQARRFLSDRSRNRYDAGRDRLLVSKIFDWYGGDFARGLAGIESVPAFLSRYADRLADDPAVVARIRSGTVGIAYLDYDWQLNRTTR